MSPPLPTKLSEEAKSLLIAEILGDVGRVHEQINQLSSQLHAMNVEAQDQANRLARWHQVLDTKMIELNRMDLSSMVSERMAGYACEYLKTLSREASGLMAVEVKPQTGSTQLAVDVKTRAYLFFGCVAAVGIGNLLWTALVYWFR